MPDKIKKPDEKAFQLEIRDSILDNLEFAVYVSDMTSNEILYANAVLRRMVGNAPLIGRICWEALKNKSKRCKECPISHLLKNPYKAYQWEIHGEQGHFQIKDSIIPWPGGKLEHLQCMVEILKP